MPSYLREFLTALTFGTTSPQRVDFGFNADRVYVVNRSPKTVYLTFSSRDPSSADYPIESSGARTYEGILVAGLSLASTATSSAGNGPITIHAINSGYVSA